MEESRRTEIEQQARASVVAEFLTVTTGRTPDRVEEAEARAAWLVDLTDREYQFYANARAAAMGALRASVRAVLARR